MYAKVTSYLPVLPSSHNLKMSKIDAQAVLRDASNFDPNAILRGAQLTLVGGSLFQVASVKAGG